MPSMCPKICLCCNYTISYNLCLICFIYYLFYWNLLYWYSQMINCNFISIYFWHKHTNWMAVGVTVRFIVNKGEGKLIIRLMSGLMIDVFSVLCGCFWYNLVWGNDSLRCLKWMSICIKIRGSKFTRQLIWVFITFLCVVYKQVTINNLLLRRTERKQPRKWISITISIRRRRCNWSRLSRIRDGPITAWGLCYTLSNDSPWWKLRTLNKSTISLQQRDSFTLMTKSN